MIWTTGNELDVTYDLDCATEGEGNNEGCVQSKRTLAIRLKEPIPAHEYEISFTDLIFDGQFILFRFTGSAEDVGQHSDLDGITDKKERL